NNRPIFIADPKNESVGYILGKEVVIDDNLTDGTIILGNLNYMGYNMPQGIMIEVSRESSFKSGLIDYRAMAIADTKPLVSEAFIKLSEATA
ncbi:phage major capsid protein, partial [Bacillus cereus]